MYTEFSFYINVGVFLSPIFSLNSCAHRPENTPSIYMKNLQECNFPEDFSPITEDFNLKYFFMMTRKASLKVFQGSSRWFKDNSLQVIATKYVLICKRSCK